MEAPTPKEIFILQQKIYFEGKNYTLKLSNPNLSEIQIKMFENESLSECENSFSLQQLQKKNNYFKMFDSIDEVIKNMDELLIDNNYAIIKYDSSSFIIEFTPVIKLKGKIELKLNLSSMNQSEKIENLISMTNSLSEIVIKFEKENNQLKSEVRNVYSKIEKFQSFEKELKELKKTVNKLNSLEVQKDEFFIDSKIINLQSQKEKILNFLKKKYKINI